MSTTINLIEKARKAYLSLSSEDAIESAQTFKHKGDMIYLIGDPAKGIVDLDASFRTQKAVLSLQRKELLESCSPVESSGLMTLLLQSAIPARLGFDITSDSDTEPLEFLFTELSGCYVATVSEDNDTEVIDFLFENEVAVMTLGHVTKGEFRIDEESFGFANDYK